MNLLTIALLLFSGSDGEKEKSQGSVVKQLTMNAVRLSQAKAPVDRAVALTEVTQALAGGLAEIRAEDSPYDAALYARLLCRVIDKGLAAHILKDEADRAEDDASFKQAVDEAQRALTQTQSVMDALSESRRTSLQPLFQLAKQRAKALSDFVNERQTRHGTKAAPEDPTRKKTGERGSGKPKEGRNFR